MIEYIKGTVASLTPTNATLETYGIGYILNISLNTYSSIQGQKETCLFVHEDIREDAYTLFGFSTESERELFQLLISVSGIGGQTARMVLSTFTPADLVNIISSEDASSLKQVKGIGPKAAGRIIIELRDKVLKLGISPSGGIQNKDTTVDSETIREAVSALSTLGFSPAPTHKVVKQLAKENPNATVEMLIKGALKKL